MNFRADGMERESVEDERVEQYISGQMQRLSAVAERAALPARVADFGAPGYCAIMSEVLWKAYYYRPQVGQHTANFRANYATYDALVADPRVPCDWPMLREAWRERGTTGRFLDPFTAVSEKRPLDERSQAIVDFFHDPRDAG